MFQSFIVSGSTRHKNYGIKFSHSRPEPTDFLENGAKNAAEILKIFYGRRTLMHRVIGESIVQAMHRIKTNESSTKVINSIDEFIEDFSTSFWPALLRAEAEDQFSEISFQFVRYSGVALVMTIGNDIFVTYSGLSAKETIIREYANDEAILRKVLYELSKFFDTQTDIDKPTSRYWKADLIDPRNN